MKLVTDRTTISKIVKQHRQNHETIGFVPTMGYLHEGHLALVEKAKEQNDIVIMSIFVNPTQFGPNEDFDSYPRDLAHDQRLAEAAGVDYIFAPSVEEMYPNKMNNQITVVERAGVLCGRSRPGHFDGVVTILLKLFSLIMPERAYFGKKDAQQIAVIDGLVQDFFLPIQIIAVETNRELDGLAKSSRNVFLSDSERVEAKELYISLTKAKTAITSGEKSKKRIIEMVIDHLQLNTSGEIDYVEIYSYPSLKAIDVIEGKVIIAIAVKFSKARLIDNLILDVR
ncbi:pantoate--beta-alanine ligase [Heyndrickxia oleronia]|jgi:pantoate--beta-alanine ligase|nr:pantoate--beta-alanine ligase [Heyndrickxia oleronia]NYV66122.1 pantoate--beta-alanine ligase [Bacillus sp. Gen3]OJH18655.1 pantoate--beta-alanine ligase [Bacillus obstructivus]MCI1592420.1 pantoate--beta-alanine ligase [Heyndrickxia oleronia]MCI1612311.1 pantoate--beta-alanine ligase [Heyndrickxia oleronia]MCI1745383.1 pantoate--beta-alanine ligase [Heyndrickxia oleronia]